MVLLFTVPGPAVPWLRTNSVKSRKVTPKRQRQFQKKVRDLAALAGASQLRGPVQMEVVVYLTGRVAPFKASSGDWDNYGKTIGDALNEMAYQDDCQVVDGRVRKLAPDAQGPRVEVMLKQLESQAQQEVTPCPSRKPRSRLSPSVYPPGGVR